MCSMANVASDYYIKRYRYKLFSPYRMFYWDCVGLAHVKQEARLGNRTMGKKEGRKMDGVRRNNQRGKKRKEKLCPCGPRMFKEV